MLIIFRLFYVLNDSKYSLQFSNSRVIEFLTNPTSILILQLRIHEFKQMLTKPETESNVHMICELILTSKYEKFLRIRFRLCISRRLEQRSKSSSRIYQLQFLQSKITSIAITEVSILFYFFFFWLKNKEISKQMSSRYNRHLLAYQLILTFSNRLRGIPTE